MLAILHPSLSRTIVLTSSLGDTLPHGYSVKLHGLPDYTFIVEATTGDDAHHIAYGFVRREKPSFRDSGATFQRVEHFAY